MEVRKIKKRVSVDPTTTVGQETHLFYDLLFVVGD
jgi:hypothetical protein